MQRLLVLAVLLVTGAAGAAPRTVAVSYFDNNTGQAELQPLAKGLADMLITDLSGLEAVRIVERDRLNAVLAELELSRSRFIDPKTAQKLGKGLAAEYVMTGAFALAGGALRIDVRVVKVDSGQVVAAEKVEGKKEEFFALEKELVDVLCGALAVKLQRGEKVKLHTNATQSWDAWTSYSAGLDAADRGDAARAQKLYEQALAADPGYAAARTALERLKAMFAQADRATIAQADAELGSLDPKAKDFTRRVEELLLKLDWTDTEQSRRKTTLLLWLGQRGILTCSKTAGPAPGSPHILQDGVPAGGVISHCREAHEVLRIANELMDDPTVGDHLLRICEGFMRRLPGDRALASYCRNTIVPGVAEVKGKPDERTVHQAPRMKAMLAAFAALP